MPDSPTGLQKNSDTLCLTRNSQTCLSFCLSLPFLFQGEADKQVGGKEILISDTEGNGMKSFFVLINDPVHNGQK